MTHARRLLVHLMNDESIDVVQPIEPSGDRFLDRARRDAAALSASGVVPEDFIEKRADQYRAEFWKIRKELEIVLEQRQDEFKKAMSEIKELPDKIEEADRQILELKQLREAQMGKVMVGMSASDVANTLNSSDAVKKMLMERIETLAEPVAHQITVIRMKHFLFEIRILIFAILQCVFAFFPVPLRYWLQFPTTICMAIYWYYNYRKLLKPIFDRLKEKHHG